MGGRGEETTTLGNRQKRTQQITPCPSLAPDIPLSPGKMSPSFHPPAWFRGKLPGRSVRRPQSFADSLLRFGLAGRQLTVSLNRNSEQYPQKGPQTSTAKGGDAPPERRSAELFFSEKNYSAVRLQMRVCGSAGNNTRSTDKPLGVTGASVRLPV